MLAETIPYTTALIAGLLSFFSPCILPLIPGYFTFITGFSLEELTERTDAEIRRKVILTTVFYVSGFSLVFILMGASASYLGGIISKYDSVIRIVGGIFILIMGIHLMGIFRIPWLEFDKRIQLNRKSFHLMGAFVIGMAFGAGWSPCIGPMLMSILVLAGTQETVYKGISLLAVYSAGLAIPFLIISVFVNFILSFLKKAIKVVRFVNYAAGALLILVGLALVTNRLALFNSFLY